MTIIYLGDERAEEKKSELENCFQMTEAPQRDEKLAWRPRNKMRF